MAEMDPADISEDAEILRIAVETNPYPTAEEHARACRERDAAIARAEAAEVDRERLAAELERMRTAREADAELIASYDDLLDDAKHAALAELEDAFRQGWDRCREFAASETELRRHDHVGRYSNLLPWPGVKEEGRP